MSTQQTEWAWANRGELRQYKRYLLCRSYMGSFQGLASIAAKQSPEYIQERLLDLVKAYEKADQEQEKQWEEEDAGRNPSA